MEPLVIDISHWQPDPIDWASVKGAGIVGVIHKATEGTGYVDPKLFSRASAAMDAGLKWSTYHFLRPGSMSDQMDFYLNTIDPVQGERVCLDHEDQDVHIGGLEYCVNYLRVKRPDLQVTIYSGHVIKEQLGSKTSPTLATTSLWLAQYSASPSWPKQVWLDWTLWQYTDKGRIPGIKGDIDLDYFNGSATDCERWFGGTGTVPVPEETPEVTVTTKGKVRVTVNGIIVTD